MAIVVGILRRVANLANAFKRTRSAAKQRTLSEANRSEMGRDVEPFAANLRRPFSRLDTLKQLVRHPKQSRVSAPD